MRFSFLFLLFTSCSVAMAVKKEGVDLKFVESLQTKEEILRIADDPIYTEDRTEVYRILKNRGSLLRASLHGLLDLITFGAWELAATPIESHLTQEQYFSLTVTYDEEGNIIYKELQ